jgi:outer membrane murein-binding lipoprotein Lpp
LQKGTLRGEHIKNNIFAVESDDLEALKLANQSAEVTQYQRLEHRVNELAEQVERLSASVAVLAEQVKQVTERQGEAREEPKAPPREQRERVRRASEQESASELPGGIVSARAEAVLHGIAETTMRKAIASGRLPTVRGEWKQGRAIVKEGLSDEGRARFYELFHGNANFKACGECPHEAK